MTYVETLFCRFMARSRANRLPPTQKYGRANEKTPAQWNKDYVDYHLPADGTTSAPAPTPTAKPKQLEPASNDVAMAEPTTNGAEEDESPAVTNRVNGATSNGAQEGEAKDEKKRKRHEGETAEEKAERKRKKKDKKVKRESKS